MNIKTIVKNLLKKIETYFIKKKAYKVFGPPTPIKGIDMPGVGEKLGEFARNVTWNVEAPRLTNAIIRNDKMRLDFSGTTDGEYYRDLTKWLRELEEHRKDIRKYNK